MPSPHHLLNQGYYIAPTIFTEVRPDMTIAQEEIFGPVTTMISFSSEQELLLAITIEHSCSLFR
jgi:acyl-CoA reductase-like NAD-dependent aldehyde dehydrogenase